MDKMIGGWIGQMVGVAWGAPTEFGWAGELIPVDRVPTWRPTMINDAFNQDDLYVEIPFLDVMKTNGVNCDPSLLAKSFRTSTFALWHANGMGRDNLRSGIGYPDSGSYLYNYHCDDIDWQIECDFLGMMYPGLINEAAKRAFEIGHIMNYGDGVYGGVFVTAMHASAYTAKTVEEICLDGIHAIPEGTLFRELVDDVYASYKAGDTFEENWRKLQDKWGDTDICPELFDISNIDAKLNSGYILLGMLYGGGDIAKTIILSMRCGQDSDCNPSSAASVLGTFYGASALPETYTKSLKHGAKFATTKYSFDDTVELNFSLLEEALTNAGATKNDDGSYTYERDLEIVPVPFEQVPDGVHVYTKTRYSNNIFRIQELTPFAKNDRVASFTVDYGDGTVIKDAVPYAYVYEKAGSYTVKITVKGEKGSVAEKEIPVEVKADYTGANDAPIVLCTICAPTGGGSKDPRVMADGYTPKAGDPDSRQYDTFIPSDPHGNRYEYAGLFFKNAVTVSTFTFTEGNHFGNGGWFKKGTIHVEVLTEDGWKTVETTVSPAYPDGTGKNDFGDPFETFVFTLTTPVVTQGVRIAGIAGGSASFISIGELSVA